MGNVSPRVSVIVTTYNQASFVGEALSSVLSQTYQPFEIIVVDDGSTDDTSRALSAFRNRIRLECQDNQGVAASRNTGVRLASGELVAFLDGDDLWDPDKLAAQVSAAQDHPESGLIATDGVQFSQSSILAPSLFMNVEAHFGQEQPVITASCYREFIQGNLISSLSQVMIPREVLGQVGFSNTRFRLASDYDLYLRISARYPMTFVRTPLTRWRYHPTSASGPQRLRFLKYSEENIPILKAQLSVAPRRYHPTIRRTIARNLIDIAAYAYDYGRDIDRQWAARFLWRLFLRNPRPSVGFFLVGLWLPDKHVRTAHQEIRTVLRAYRDLRSMRANRRSA